MNSWRQLTLILYMVSLTLWIAAIIAPAVCALAAFGTLPGLGVSLQSYELFMIEGQPDVHARIAAGTILEKVFTGSDFVQVALAFFVAVMLAIDLLVFRQSLWRVSNLIRTLCIVVAIALLAFHVFLQAPDMNRELRAYWDEARAGNIDAALEHRAVFDEYHPRAEMILEVNLLLLVIAMGASAAAMVPQSSDGKSGLENPKLATR